jgi:hypothetical protein
MKRATFRDGTLGTVVTVVVHRFGGGKTADDKALMRMTGQNAAFFEETDGACVLAGTRATIWIQRIDWPLICHESLHATRGLLSYMGINDEEAECLYLQWLTGRIKSRFGTRRG